MISLRSRLQSWWQGKASDTGSIRTSLDLFREVFGSRKTRSGESVTWSTAIEVSTVLACVRVIAEGCAQVPFRLHRETGTSRAPVTDHPLSMVLYRRPNPWQTSFEFRETLLFHTVLTGNSYCWINRVGRAGKIKELIPLEPGRVEVIRGKDMSLTYRFRPENGDAVDFPDDAIWHIKGPSWDSWRGMETVKLAREAIGLSIALEGSQSDLHKNGLKTSGLYSVDGTLSKERYATLREFFEKEFSTGRPLILDQGAKYTPFTMSGADAQHLETRRLQIEEICRAFRVMPIMVGHADKTATYASAEQMFLAHVVHTLMPWYQRIEQSADVNLLTEQELADGYYTKFNANALLRGAARDRFEAYGKALGSGGSPMWMTVNEIRALEDMDPIEGGDELHEPSNVGTKVAEPALAA